MEHKKLCKSSLNCSPRKSSEDIKKYKNKQRYLRWAAIFLSALALAGIAVFVATKIIYKPIDYVYPGFQIRLPQGYTLHGIDVSRYQKNINWASVKKMKSGGINLQFAFIKATEGTQKVDPQFRRNWEKAQEAGLVKGAYHFYRPGQNPKLQALNFIQYTNLQKGDLPPVLDIELTEGTNKEKLQAGLKVWLGTIENETKAKPIIYTNAHFYETYLAGDFDEYPLWVAHYFAPGDSPQVRRQWQFWQHSEKGRVNGIEGYVDFNVFNGSYYEFNQLLLQNVRN